jgi:2',3'-cyclic-nucleotide 2'-phosphodiesterase/3'-nucleotidase
MAAAALTACGGGGGAGDGVVSGGGESAGPPVQVIPEGTTVTLALMETTDLQASVMSYNYYTMAEDPNLGMERTSTLVKQVRAENPNTVLLDNGDNIRGSLMGDLQTLAAPVGCDGTMAVHKVMNAMKYDAGGFGDHDFNFGLSLISQITNTDLKILEIRKPVGPCGAPAFPLVLSNVTGVTLGRPILPPYALLPRDFAATAPDGGKISVRINIGVMSFVPPTIMEWDASKLEGKIVVGGVREAANKYVPELRGRGADLVVALSHGGLDTSAYSPTMENGSYHLAGTGIDALMIGHTQQIFPQARERGGPTPDPSFAAYPAGAGIDPVKGFVKGVPTVMAQAAGRRLGIIKMTLIYSGGAWAVQPAKTTVEARGFKYADGVTPVAADPAIAPLVAAEHAAAKGLTEQSLAAGADFASQAYFALAGDVAATQLVNQAQADYVKHVIATSGDAGIAGYKNLPVLSASRLFKAGGKGPADYLDQPAGDLLVRNIGDLYPNGEDTIHALKISGAELKSWLETVAGRYARIDPALETEQDLVPSFDSLQDYDVFYADGDALHYRIDVTQPAGARIVDLVYQGKPVLDGDAFIVATGTRRADGGGRFPGLSGKTVFRSFDTVQTLLRNYLVAYGANIGALTSGPRNWSFVPAATAGPVILRSAPGHLELAAVASAGLITAEREADATGYASYTVELGQGAAKQAQLRKRGKTR